MPQPDLVMNCPFCARMLTKSNANDAGRYSCPDCAPTSQEARHGWKPRPPAQKKDKPQPAAQNVAQRFADNPMFAKDQAGDAVTRERACECGAAFTQRLLSERFFRIIAARGKACLEQFERQIPDGFVPVHCPKCERIDLGRRARLDDMQPHHTERNEAAD